MPSGSSSPSGDAPNQPRTSSVYLSTASNPKFSSSAASMTARCLRLAAARIAFFRSFSAALSRAFPPSPIRAIASAASHVVPVVAKMNGSPARLLEA